MDDVTRALEKAAESMNAYHHTDEDGTPPVDRIMREASRAAVLACVQSLPTTMTVAELAAAIEKERT